MLIASITASPLCRELLIDSSAAFKGFCFIIRLKYILIVFMTPLFDRQ